MATYGPYYGVADNGRQLRVTIIALQDAASNTSTVRAILELISTNGTPAFSDSMQIGTVINGVQTAWWQGSASYGSGTFLLADSYRVISHDANGNASTTVIGALADASGPFSLSVQVNTLTLPNIPRGTTPAIVGGGGFTTGTASTINLTPADPAYKHDVSYKFGAQSGPIGSPGAGTSVTWTPPHTLLTEIPNAVTGTVEITVVTKSGATVIGTKKANFSLTAGATVVPTVSGVTWDDTNTTVKSVVGAFVQGQSLISGVVAAAGVQGSTIASKSLVVAGANMSESQVWQPATPGTVVASGQATDSRGRTGSTPANFSVLAYASPALTTATLRRAIDAAGTLGQGSFLRLDLTAAVQSLFVGTQKNALKLYVRTRPVGGAYTVRNDITHTALTYSNTLVMVTGGGIFSPSTSYDVEITISDNLGNKATLIRTVGTDVAFDIAGNGTGHGKIWERGAVDASGNVYVSGSVYVGPTDTPVSLVGHTHTGAQVTAATTAARGTVPLATPAQVNTGTDNTVAVTPYALANATRIPYAVSGGRVIVAASGVTTVTFPSGRFSQIPAVLATVYNNGNVCIVHITGVTATSFGVRIYTIGGGQVGGDVAWEALQMTPTSTNG